MPDLQRGIAQGLAAVQLQHVELQLQRDAWLAIGDVLTQQRIFQVEGSGSLYWAEAAGSGGASLAELRPVQGHQAAQAKLKHLAAGGVHEGTPLLESRENFPSYAWSGAAAAPIGRGRCRCFHLSFTVLGCILCAP
ncbi:hypothetical protein D3C81_1787120 [compost metagenome]